MKGLCSIVLLFVLAACGLAGAESTSRPTLRVEYLQTDSVRVIARWSRPCDAKGCADKFTVQWQLNTLPKATAYTVDTAYFKKPAFGDTLAVTVFVVSIRRKIEGAMRSASVVIRNPDAAPPPVDSLRADTLETRADSIYEAALLDTFPVWVARDSLGQQPPRTWGMSVGDNRTLCILSRSRYTGEARILVAGDAPPAMEAWLMEHCETARSLYAGERGG